MITVTWLPLQKGGPRTVDLGRELPNFLNREINPRNEKEEERRCTLTLGLRSFASHCLCAAHDQMFCSLLLEKGTRVTDLSGLPTPFFYLCTHLSRSHSGLHIRRAGTCNRFFCFDTDCHVMRKLFGGRDTTWQPERTEMDYIDPI